MLDNNGFDLWANKYDKSFGLSEEKISFLQISYCSGVIRLKK